MSPGAVGKEVGNGLGVRLGGGKDNGCQQAGRCCQDQHLDKRAFRAVFATEDLGLGMLSPGGSL